MEKTDFSIEHVATLARINLSEAEKAEFSEQLEHILSYVDQLQAIETLDVAETAQVTGLEDVLRDDVATEATLEDRQAARREYLAAAPSLNTELTMIKVPAILGDGE